MNGRDQDGSAANDKPWLLVGLSVRPLAEAAAAGGHAICAIDAFGDRETRAACAGRTVTLALDRAWRIGADALSRALREAQQCAPAGFAGIVPCSGFEAQPELLDLLVEAGPLVGNDAATMNRVRDPRRWFSLLDRMDAPYPAVSFSPPTLYRDWLIKSAGGSGGWHVRPWHGAGPQPVDAYFQRRAPGQPASVLFVADGRTATIIGWQWQSLAPTAQLPWRYGGVIVATNMAVTVRRRVTRVVSAIVAETGLCGLCGLDFLIIGEAFSLLELNPRPTASVALYADQNLFALHRDACHGILAAPAPQRARGAHAVGECVFYAPDSLDIAADFVWPGWCRDVPLGSARLGTDDPVCSIRATGSSPATVRARLARRLHALATRLMENQTDEFKPRERQWARRTASPVPAC